MRITQQMLHQNSVRHMNQNLSRLNKTYNQALTGKLLHRPSDDPNGVSKAIQLKSTIAAYEQYERNTNHASVWLDETDQTINGMVNVMQRARELAVKGSNDTLNEHDRKAIADEVEQIKEHIRQFANTKVNGKYLFNGQKTNQAPYPATDSYETNSFDTGAMTFAIGDGVTVKANVTADQLFGNAGDESNLFQTLEQVAAGIRSGEAIPLDQIDTGIDRMLTTQAQTGAQKNRIDAVANRLQDSNIALQSMLSNIEDIDLAEAVTKLKAEESIYQASLSATAKVIQPSLMDFIR